MDILILIIMLSVAVYLAFLSEKNISDQFKEYRRTKDDFVRDIQQFNQLVNEKSGATNPSYENIKPYSVLVEAKKSITPAVVWMDYSHLYPVVDNLIVGKEGTASHLTSLYLTYVKLDHWKRMGINEAESLRLQRKLKKLSIRRRNLFSESAVFVLKLTKSTQEIVELLQGSFKHQPTMFPERTVEYISPKERYKINAPNYLYPLSKAVQ